MKPFEYTYKTPQEIFEIMSISSNSFMTVVGVILSIAIAIMTINYFFPFISIAKLNYKQLRQKKKKKNLMRQIILQKEMEEEIEKDLGKK